MNRVFLYAAGAFLFVFLLTKKIMVALFAGFVVLYISNQNNKQKGKPKSANASKIFSKNLLKLSALLMKADGKPLKSELDYIKQFLFRQFGEDLAQKHLLVLRDYLKHDINILEVCEELNQILRVPSKVQLLHYLVNIARADADITNKEFNLLLQITQLLRLPRYQLDQILAIINFGNYQQKQTYNNKDYKYQQYQQTYTSSAVQLENAYKILGLTKNASADEIKKAYRKMAVKHHPDKVRHLGKEYQKGAQEKFQKINEAYEMIKDAKGFK